MAAGGKSRCGTGPSLPEAADAPRDVGREQEAAAGGAQSVAVGDKSLSRSLKMRLYKQGVLSIITYGCEAWTLTQDVQRKLNGWNGRCLAVITGRTVHEESSERTRTFDLVGTIRLRRRVWLGHILRSPPEDGLRQEVLRQAGLEAARLVTGNGGILMDAPAYSSVDQLVAFAGGWGSKQDREESRRRWAKECRAIPKNPAAATKSDGDDDATASSSPRLQSNTAAQTAKTLEDLDHVYRLYTDGGVNRNKETGEWGTAGWGAHVIAVDAENSSTTVRADLFGPVVTDSSSAWFQGATRGTNNTGELCGVAQALLWLRDCATEDGAAVILFDSLDFNNSTC